MIRRASANPFHPELRQYARFLPRTLVTPTTVKVFNVVARNWRQARRTQLTDDTTTALFILDALDPMTDDALDAAARALVAHLTNLGPGAQVARRLIASGTEGD